MWYLSIALAIICVFFYRRGKAHGVTTMYLLNVKPALEKCGFVGTDGYVIEESGLVEALYYFRDYKRFGDEGLVRLLRDPLEEIEEEAFGIEPEEDCEERPPTRYEISFEATQRGRSNKGVLTLTAHDSDAIGGRSITTVVAPLAHFNETNLKGLLARIAGTVRRSEGGGAQDKTWYVYGIAVTTTDEAMWGLGSVEMSKANTAPTTRTKQALKRLTKGYA